MKEFNNEIEREFLLILKKMEEKIEVNLGSYLSECILKNDRLIGIDNKKISLLFNIEKENELTFVKDLSIIISLIELLKDEKLIFTHINPEILNNKLVEFPKKKISNPIKNENFVTALTSDKNIQNKIDQNPTHYGIWELPTTLSDFILEYIDQFCYVRPELTEYIKNDFNTSEQIRFRKTLLWTRAATLISFLGLLIAISLPFITKTEVIIEKENEKPKITLENKTNQISSKEKDTSFNKGDGTQ